MSNPFIEKITSINDTVNGVVWGWPALILLGFVGILMTCLTGFFQISHFGHWWKNTIGIIVILIFIYFSVILRLYGIYNVQS